MFKRRRFPVEIILLCVRWYCKYGISYRDLAEMMSERGVAVDPSTIFRWVQRYAPEIEKRIRPYQGPRSGSWRVDETYLIAPEEAERWMTENPYRIWVRNISCPGLPAAALNTSDMHTLYLCSVGYNIRRVEAHGNMRWRVQRLCKRGITIERGWRRGIYPYYRLKDIVEYEISGRLCRLEPHRDYQDLQQG
jgi:hypothetical protein